MNNSKAYLTLTKERQFIEDQLEIMNENAKVFSEQAKKLKKGSFERESMMMKSNQIKMSVEYKVLKSQLETFNFCINTTFYL